MIKCLLFVFLLVPTSVIVAQKNETDSITNEPVVLTDYELILLKADSAITRQDFILAKEYYTRASRMRPTDPFPFRMIKSADNSIKALERAGVRDAELRRKAEINQLMADALKAVLEKRYDTARALYSRVLTLNPVKSQEEFAKLKIQSIDEAFGSAVKTNAPTSSPSAAREATARKENTLIANKSEVEKFASKPLDSKQQNAKAEKSSPALSGNPIVSENKTTETPAKRETVTASMTSPGPRKFTNPSPDSTAKKVEADKNNVAMKTNTAGTIAKDDKSVAKTSSEKTDKTDATRLASGPVIPTGSNTASAVPQKTPEPKKASPEVTSNASKTEVVKDNKSAEGITKKESQTAIVATPPPSKPLSEAVSKQKTESDLASARPKENAPAQKDVSASTNNPMALKSTGSNGTEKPRVEETNNRTSQFDETVHLAIKAMNEEKWADALNFYRQVLALNPTKVQEDAIKKEIEAINSKIDRIQNKPGQSNSQPLTAINRADKTPASKPVSSLANKTPSSRSKASNDQPAPLSGSRVENDRANTAALNRNTADRPFDSSDREVNSQNIEFSKSLLYEASKLNIADINNDVKLVCQGIGFKGDNAFIRFLVSNLSTNTDFIPGNLKLTYIKNYGILKRLNGRYILDVSAVSPKKETPFVFVTEIPGSVEPNEVFVFEMEDKYKQTKLTINISGEAFLKQRNNGAPM